jgi:divalent metal cation (Fe/Co/Zn/Cd) transporter
MGRRGDGEPSEDPPLPLKTGRTAALSWPATAGLGITLLDVPPAPSARERAALLCASTVAWNMIIGGAAVLTAVVTGSLSLIGFGANAVVDSSVSSLLVWRFLAKDEGRVQHVERLALRVAAVAFLLVATYLTVRASLALAEGHRATFSVFGIIEAAASLVVLPYLAVSKYRLSVRLRSRALRADSLLTVSGIALAAVTLVGLVLQHALGWGWADPVAALVIAVFLALEGFRTLRDDQT